MMIDTDGIITEIQDFFHRKPLLFTVIAIIIFLFFAGLVVVFIQSSPEKKQITQNQEQFIPLFAPLPPSESEIEKDYYPFRVTEEHWSDEEIKAWITVPDEAEIKKIEKANDLIVSDITEAAP